jgi:hypothetical protein
MYIPKNQSACTKQTEATGLDTQESNNRRALLEIFSCPVKKRLRKLSKTLKAAQPTHSESESIEEKSKTPTQALFFTREFGLSERGSHC